MTDNPLASLAAYSNFVAETLNRESVESSKVTDWSASPYTGTVNGELFFVNEYRLRLREEIEEAVIEERKTFLQTARRLNLEGAAEWARNVDGHLYGDKAGD